MRVIFFDRTIIDVNDRSEAVKVIKDGLSKWMEPSDHISWSYSQLGFIKEGNKPNVAYVMTKYGELTDAYAIIV